MRAKAPALKFSTTMSEAAISFSTTSRPSGW